METYMILILGLSILLPILFLLYMQFSSPPSPTTTSTTLKDKEGYVTKEIKPENISGKVKIKGSKTWSATADKKIEKGTKVRIYEVKGVHLKVEKIKEVEEVPLPEREIEEEMICPTCGSVNPPDAEECPLCGEVLITSEGGLEKMEEIPLPPLGGEIEEEMICPTCGSVNSPDAEECSVCGDVLKPSEEGLEEMKEVPTRERDIKEIENLEKLEKEIEEEDICPSCSSIILIDVAECPECGEKLPEEEGFFQFFRDIKDSIRSR